MSSEENLNRMIFVDQYIDDSIIHLMEVMTNHHILGNYQEVRNIILGYDSKRNIWISKYGEYLSKINLDGDKLVNEHPVNKQSFEKKGMAFYDGEIYENVKILMDESVKRVLHILFTLSKNVIEYRQIIDIIVTEWNRNNVKNNLTEANINPDICGSLRLHGIEIKEDSWKNLKRISKSKGLSVSNTFKQAVVEFLEHRADMLSDSDYVQRYY